MYAGHIVRKEDLTRSAPQLYAISGLSALERRFIATLADTEAAIGYYRATVGTSNWTSYFSVKMKNPGDVAYFSELVGLRHPAPTRGWNTLARSYDLRWGKQVMGVVAYALLARTRPFMHNEKTMIESDCIISHGPIVRGGPHPFTLCGGVTMRRGVWVWSAAGNEDEAAPSSTAIK